MLVILTDKAATIIADNDSVQTVTKSQVIYIKTTIKIKN
jgi:hypothetical protein